MNAVKRLNLFVHTVRHLRGEQILWRIWLRGLAVWDRKTSSGLQRSLSARAQEMAAAVHPERFLPGLRSGHGIGGLDTEHVLTEAEQVQAGIFTFQNHTERFPTRVDWRSAHTTALWRYHLHYFDYALSLGLAAQLRPDMAARYATCLQDLISSWWAANPLAIGEGWRPYPLSLRIVNWIYAAVCFGPHWPPEFRRRIDRSIAEQALFLRRHLEFDVGGNHLLKNAKALYLAGLYCDGALAEELVQLGEELLLRELEVQILPDGGHYERSAHYHRIVLTDWMEALVCSRQAGRVWTASALDRLRRAAEYLEGILHPDGEIPLFGDATMEWPSARDVVSGSRAVLGEERAAEGLWGWMLGCSRDGPPLTALAEVSSVPTVQAFSETGYAVLRSGPLHAILDTGLPCPPDLPAHAHSDGLSVEVSLGERRLVVDPGTYLYQDASWRDYLRSTAAHNTVHVPGEEQTETWGQFRAARRAIPLPAKSGTVAEFAWATGTMVYGTDRRLIHQRWLVVWPRGFLLVDHLSRRFAEARARLLLAPGQSTVAGGGRVLLNGPSGPFTAVAAGSYLSPMGPSRGPGPGWYSPRFGILEESVSLEWGRAAGGWFAFALVQGAGECTLDISSSGIVTCKTDQVAFEGACSNTGVRVESLGR